MSSFSHFLQTCDATFPVGSFAHSFGLEGWLSAQANPGPKDLERFIDTAVGGLLRQVDFPVLLGTHQAVLSQDPEMLRTWDDLAVASRGSREAREALLAIGSQKRTLLIHLYPDLGPKLDALLPDGAPRSLPALDGVCAALFDLEPEDALTAHAYQALSAVLAASLKLMRIGQQTTQVLLRKNLDLVPEWIKTARSVAPGQVGWFNPLLDLCEARHETAWTRIFIS